MKISFENPDKVNGLMTLTVEESDYKDKVDTKLKEYRKKANVPGFRPGQAPLGMIKRQFGTSVKVDEINKLLGEEMYKYIKDNNIQMLGEPLPSDKQEPQDLEKEAPYTFKFDIAVAPEFKAELSADDTVDYYDIEVSDKLVQDQVDMFAQRSGHYDKVEEYDGEQRDMLKGDLQELNDKGEVKEHGISLSDVVLMPTYIKDEDQKKLFDGAKLGSSIVFNPSKAYEGNATEISAMLKVDRDKVDEYKGDFLFQVTEISRFVKAPVDQKLFDFVFGKDTVKSEEEFRNKIREGLSAQLSMDSDYKFLIDVRKYLENKVGKLQYPDALLKRIMLRTNKDKGEDFVEKNYDKSIDELTWHLIREQLVAANKIKVDDNDVKEVGKEMARMQFAQYGMSNVEDEYLDKYVSELLKKEENVNSFVDRAIDKKLEQALKKVVKLNKKPISLDDFNKMMSE